MRLSLVRLAYNIHTKPIGFRYRGKNREFRPITMGHMRELKNDLEREELNMLWLRHPYLTIEQDHGHMEHDHAQRLKKLKAEWIAIKARKWVKPKIITDNLKCLMVSDAWE